ncbi:hypothetical protein [Enhygromyxa salina]|uniref:hypothetical protein n=1 Tax=Enhygromyxa salina TaxID=215803 RepID=UPI000D03C9D4|nr:hypothetical protein [Enhygromyxa salina]
MPRLALGRQILGHFNVGVTDDRLTCVSFGLAVGDSVAVNFGHARLASRLRAHHQDRPQRHLHSLRGLKLLEVVQLREVYRRET